MSTLSSTPSPRRLPPNRRRAGWAAGLAAAGLFAVSPAQAQHVVFDPRNHLENALQAARQLESLANEAKSLAASPYSHLGASSQSLRDAAELARSVQGLAASVEGVEQQFESLYSDAPAGVDILSLIDQGQARAETTRRTAQDLARTAAELERMGEGRDQRLAGALAASEAASGQTAAIQSSNQMLAVLAEDLAAMRTALLAQSRLMAQDAARETADQAAGASARRERWAGRTVESQPPDFDPFSRARD